MSTWFERHTFRVFRNSWFRVMAYSDLCSCKDHVILALVWGSESGRGAHKKAVVIVWVSKEGCLGSSGGGREVQWLNWGQILEPFGKNRTE